MTLWRAPSRSIQVTSLEGAWLTTQELVAEVWGHSPHEYHLSAEWGVRDQFVALQLQVRKVPGVVKEGMAWRVDDPPAFRAWARCARRAWAVVVLTTPGCGPEVTLTMLVCIFEEMLMEDASV